MTSSSIATGTFSVANITLVAGFWGAGHAYPPRPILEALFSDLGRPERDLRDLGAAKSMQALRARAEAEKAA